MSIHHEVAWIEDLKKKRSRDPQTLQIHANPCSNAFCPDLPSSQLQQQGPHAARPCRPSRPCSCCRCCARSSRRRSRPRCLAKSSMVLRHSTDMTVFEARSIMFLAYIPTRVILLWHISIHMFDFACLMVFG